MALFIPPSRQSVSPLGRSSLSHEDLPPTSKPVRPTQWTTSRVKDFVRSFQKGKVIGAVSHDQGEHLAQLINESAGANHQLNRFEAADLAKDLRTNHLKHGLDRGDAEKLADELFK